MNWHLAVANIWQIYQTENKKLNKENEKKD